jgi:hypothetical protein
MADSARRQCNMASKYSTCRLDAKQNSWEQMHRFPNARIQAMMQPQRFQ